MSGYTRMPLQVQVDYLKHNVMELQQQLQKSYVRIKELMEELQKAGLHG